MAYKYVYGVDVWEGSLDIDEPTLKAAGIEFTIIRLNDIRGGHKVDRGFDLQWLQSEAFIRWPYFVYNPWVSGKVNYEFLARNMPDCGAVSADIEVRYNGCTPTTYARELATFLKLTAAEWNVNIYTGYWFLGFLSEWPKDYEYWWAQYPYVLYPEQKMRSTWSTVMKRIAELQLFPPKSPGPCRLRQVTADRYVLPGCADRPIDINVWNGTPAELREWVNGCRSGKKQAGSEISIPEWAIAIDQWARQEGYSGPRPSLRLS